MGALDDSVPFQLQVWGYALTGDACDRDAIRCEDRHVRFRFTIR